MLIIGLTGGIGSGKTAVSDKFESLGITVVDADLASRKVVELGQPALKEIEEYFGSEIITEAGTLDREKLRELIAFNEEKRKWLESTLHPLIGEQISLELSNSKSKYTVFVAPLLLETDAHNMCSRILVVDVPVETQITRTTNRDKTSADQVKKIISVQMDRKERLKRADDVIENTGSIEELEKNVELLHQKYLALVNE